MADRIRSLKVAAIGSCLTKSTPRAGGVVTAIYSAPLCTEDAVYFGSFDGYLYALERDSGALKWRIRPVEGTHVTSSPLTDGRTLFVAIQRDTEKRGEHAIVAIGEDEGGKGRSPQSGR
jgi:outer membrane protein assembly factor BamB